MKTVIYTKLEEKFLDEWQSLWESSPDSNYVNSPSWLLAVLESFKYKSYVVIAMYENDRLTAVAALVKERMYGVDFYTVPPGDFVCGIPFLADIQEKGVVEALTENLLKIGNIFLDNVPEQLVDGLKENNAGVDSVPYGLNFYMIFNKDDKGQVVIRNREKRMRKVKNIEEKFQLQSFGGESLEALEVAFRIDDQSRKRVRQYSTFSDESSKQFYKSLAKHFKKNFLINILYYEGSPIAYEMGFIVGTTYFGNQLSFIEEYGDYAPGKVIIVKLIESLGTRNIERLDFGSGDDHLKRSFTNESRPLYKVIIAKNILIRNYIKTIYLWKDKLFNQIRKNVKVYSTYRMMKKWLV